MTPTRKAVLIFSRSSQADALAKGIPGGDRLFDQLTAETLLKVRRSGLPWFHFGSKEQTGSSFGARLTNAIAQCFEKGFEELIVIGNDTPALTTQLLREAASALHRKKTVLGPAPDGGTYLIGIHRSVFVRKDFEGLPWQDHALFESLRNYIQARSGHFPAELKCLKDLDCMDDLRHLARIPFLAGSDIIRLIRGLISHSAGSVFQTVDIPIQIFTGRRYNKGSPGLR